MNGIIVHSMRVWRSIIVYVRDGCVGVVYNYRVCARVIISGGEPQRGWWWRGRRDCTTLLRPLRVGAENGALQPPPCCNTTSTEPGLCAGDALEWRSAGHQRNWFQGHPWFRRATTDRSRVAPLFRLFSGSEYPLQTTGRVQDWECYWTSRPLTRLWLRSRLWLWPETLRSPRVPRDQVNSVCLLECMFFLLGVRVYNNTGDWREWRDFIWQSCETLYVAASCLTTGLNSGNLY